MLLKITEEIIQRNVFGRKKKNSGLSTNRPLSSCALQLAPVKQNVLFTPPTHSGQFLLRLQALDTEPYDIFSKPSYNMTHSLNRGFAVRNPYIQNIP